VRMSLDTYTLNFTGVLRIRVLGVSPMGYFHMYEYKIFKTYVIFKAVPILVLTP
jgi:hypothetical protein